MILQFTVPGRPIGSARPRVTKNGTFIPKRTKMYMNDVRRSYSKAYYFDGPVFMEVYAYFPIPKSATKKERKLIEEMDYLYTKRPDGDNIIKAVKDALNRNAYNDDAQVVYESIIRKYAKPGEEPRTEVVLYDMEGGRMDAH